MHFLLLFWKIILIFAIFDDQVFILAPGSWRMINSEWENGHDEGAGSMIRFSLNYAVYPAAERIHFCTMDEIVFGYHKNVCTYVHIKIEISRNNSQKPFLIRCIIFNILPILELSCSLYLKPAAEQILRGRPGRSRPGLLRMTARVESFLCLVSRFAR